MLRLKWTTFHINNTKSFHKYEKNTSLQPITAVIFAAKNTKLSLIWKQPVKVLLVFKHLCTKMWLNLLNWAKKKSSALFKRIQRLVVYSNWKTHLVYIGLKCLKTARMCANTFAFPCLGDVCLFCIVKTQIITFFLHHIAKLICKKSFPLILTRSF